MLKRSKKLSRGIVFCPPGEGTVQVDCYKCAELFTGPDQGDQSKA